MQAIQSQDCDWNSALGLVYYRAPRQNCHLCSCRLRIRDFQIAYIRIRILF